MYSITMFHHNYRNSQYQIVRLDLGIEEDFVGQVTFEPGLGGKMSIMSTDGVLGQGDLSKEPNQTKHERS